MVSSALSLASVTAVLRRVLENGLVTQGASASIGGDVTVSALPPDRMALGPDERPQLNLFLYHVTPNTGRRLLSRSGQEAGGEAQAQPSRAHDRASGPAIAGPMALDLYYLLTACGAQDFQSELILGYAVCTMQGTPTLSREAIRTALVALSRTGDGRIVPSALAALADSPLADQVEQIKIEPQFISVEEMSRVWTSLQARYRPSAVYKVSSVIIGDQQPGAGSPGR